MIYKRACTQREVEQCQSLLKEVYNEEYNYSLDIPDRYDQGASTYLYCESDGEIASTLRVVFPEVMGLPMEEVCTLPDMQNFIKYAEISRIAVKNKFRGQVLHADIYANVCRTGKELGLTHFVAEVNMSLVTLYKRFFCFTSLGEAVCDPDMLKKPQDSGVPNVLPMIGSIDSFLTRYVSSKFTQVDLVDMALEISKHKGLTVQGVLEKLNSVA